MSLYLFQAAYTPESWKHQIETQQNAEERLTPLVESLGGTLEHVFYAFGDYDIILICEMPSDDAAAAFSLAAAAGGSVKALKTTPLLSVNEGISAMKKASQAGKSYTAPIPQGTVRETVAR